MSTCKTCTVEFTPPGKNPGIYCSRACKSEWQRTRKPVTREWLYQKYIVEGLGAPEIAKIVNRDSKRVWQWLRDLDIPTRPRGSDERQLFKPGHQTMVGRKHSAETRAKMRAIALADGRVPFDPKVGPPLRGKRGAEVHTWKGGVTPERQAVYSSREWIEAVKIVWHRDDAKCQRCGLDHRTIDRAEMKFHVHHIVSFANKELRCEPSNLVLLCDKCHRWTHGKGNTERRFLG
jgi:hypothetical protein